MKTGEMTVSGFLEELAAKQSTPGGGGAAALTGSQAAALLCMVANFTVGAKKHAAVEAEMTHHLAEAESLRVRLLALADEDVVAFQAVTACYAMPKETDAEKAARTQAMQTALQGAARVPFATAESAVAVMQLAKPVAQKGNRNVVSDAAVALYLADAALHAAIVNVNINLKFINDAAFVEEFRAATHRLLADGAAALAEGKVACQQVLEIAL